MGLKTNLRKALYKLTGDRFVEKPEWEYMPGGWKKSDGKAGGWDDKSVLDAQKAKWPIFLNLLKGNGPVGLNHEAAKPTNLDPAAHNIIMSYAYVLALAARKKDTLSLLDWGGGIGHYFPLTEALLPPGVKLDYHCKDVPSLVRYGVEILPKAHFYEDEKCLQRCYDLVLVSGSIQYAKDWQAYAEKFANATEEYLYITRLPVVTNAPAHVVMQRPSRVGYNCEYQGWVLNRGALTECVEGFGMKLVREFIFRDKPKIMFAPEQCEVRGFLFRREKKIPGQAH